MCGISGLYSLSKSSFEARDIVTRMTNAIVHRGPDAAGLWQSRDGQITLGHRRLSIVDLSPTGAQPMQTNSGRFFIAFNGEIYNHQALRQELIAQGVSFRGHSDTEVLLNLFERFGFVEALNRCVGMFAISLWDNENQNLYLARDRMGEKPLYYGYAGSDFVFGSELKALRTHPNFKNEVNREALALYFRHNYIPAPRTIYSDIYKLNPGEWLQISKAQLSNHALPEPRPYWRLIDHVPKHALNDLSDELVVSTLDQKLKDSVGLQMMADVPVGCFLSGGVDSSTIAGVMQSLNSKPIKTFTIGFQEAGYNEAEHAKLVAQHLKTDHTELYVTSDQAQAVIPKLAMMYDEPFADSSQIPTFLVSQLARTKVTVSLSGDAGDELFGGYNRYVLTQKMWKRLALMPRPLRALAGLAIHSLGPSSLNMAYQVARPFLGAGFQLSNPADKLKKAGAVLAMRSADEIYERLISHWTEPNQLVINGHEPLHQALKRGADFHSQDVVAKLMYIDTLTYLPDDILCKVDRASMAVSLESRVPLLDHRLVEWAWSLPMKYKIRDGVSKWVLRQVLDQYVPRKLIERPKMGFGVPIDSWLRGPLKSWAQDLLSEQTLKRQGYLNS